MIGRTIGPYQVLRHLGSGGMGDVYLAEDVRLRRLVAIKRPADRWLATPTAHDRLNREARAAARLNHPNIAAIHDVIEVDGRLHIVMEYVEGQTLAALAAHGPLPPAQVVTIALQLTDALASAHALGIIHCDLKPANIWLTRDGRAKVLDFGIAKTRHPAGTSTDSGGTALLTQAGEVIGTPGYMAPELFLGQQADHRSDIYSLGAALFELLTGRPPFDTAEPLARALAALSETPPSAREVNGAVPVALDALVTRALAPAPRDRFPSVHEMRHELARIAESFPRAPTLPPDAPTVPLTAVSAPDAWPWRRWLVVVLLVIGLLALVSLPVARHWATTGPVSAVPIVAVLPLVNASVDPASDHLGLGFADSLISRLAGVPSAAVVSRRAAAEHFGRADAPERIARALGATYLVDGSYQRVGERLLVNVRLVEISTSMVRASWTYEDDLGALFNLQRRTALAVSEGLHLTLTAADRQRLERPPTLDLQAYDDYSQARALLQRHDVSGNVEEAIEKLQQAIARDGAFALAHAALGDAYWLRYEAAREPRWADRALEAIREATRLDPDDAVVRLSLGRVYAGTGRTGEGIAQIRIVLERQPGNDEAWRQLGAMLEGEGRAAEALEALQQAVARGPHFWRNHGALGNFHFRRARYAEAAAAYERAIGIEPDHVWLFENLGAAYQAAGDEPRALANYERAIQLSPDADAAHANIGRIHYMAGRLADAARSYERAIEIAPRDPLLHRNAGDTYRRLGDGDRAEAAYRRAIAIAEELLRVNPQDGGLLALRALCEAKTGQHEAARRHAQVAGEMAPADPQVQYRVAVAHALGGRHDDALDALERALASGYDPRFAREDDDLRTLAKSLRFRALLENSR